MISLLDVQRAKAAITPYVRRTALEKNSTLSQQLGTNVYLKLELFQRTGSFKPRGAFAQVLNLTQAQRNRGVVGVSGGNFAQGMAIAARELNCRAVVCMPASTPRNYIEAAEAYGAKVDLSPTFAGIFERADQYARDGWSLLHPFDNPQQMAGAGTIGLEIVEDLPSVTDVLISIGGGGLYAGIAVALTGLKPSVRVWGVETVGSETMGASLAAGRIVEIEPKSLAKTLGSPYVAKDAFEIMQRNPERYVAVTDREAFEAGVFLLERAKLNTELAASCTLAAARRISKSFGPEDHVVLLICGGNNSLENWLHYREVLT